MDNIKIENSYSNVGGFDQDDINRILKQREEGLSSENPKEKMELFETLVLHQENIKKEIEGINNQKKYLEPRTYSMRPQDYEEFQKTFKERYGVEKESQLINNDIAKYAIYYGVIKPDKEISGRIFKSLNGMFTNAKELGFNPQDENDPSKELIEKTKEVMDVKINELNNQLSNIENKLSQFNLK